MRAHFKYLFLSLVLTCLGFGSSSKAASIRWLHLGSVDTSLANLEIDGKVAYRKMPPRRATPWGKVSAGSHQFQIVTSGNSAPKFELDIIDGQKITVVSYADKDGNLKSKAVGLEPPLGEIYFLNLLPGTMSKVPDSKRKAIFGKGLWLPSGETEKLTVSVTDAEGFEGAIDFSHTGDSFGGVFLAVLSANADGKPTLTILREKDSLLEVGDEAVQVTDRFTAGIRVISEGVFAKKGGFDPLRINWEEVESEFFWINLMIDRDPCRLEISGFPAMRRMPSGRGSGFVKWPAGSWATNVVTERTNKSLSTASFSMGQKTSVGLISSGGGKYPHRLLSLEGRSRETSDKPAKARIRVVNALPDGVIKSVIRLAPEPVKISLEPGEITDAIELENGFPGAALDLTLGAMNGQVIARIPPMRTLSKGDWVIVVHLDQESFKAPALTWVEMDKGVVNFPKSPDSAE